MAESKSKTSGRRAATTAGGGGVPDGHRRLEVSYSPDGFRGVKDVPADEAAILVTDKRARYVDASTPLGEATPTPGEFRAPDNTGVDTSSTGDTGSATAGTP